jgi:hypothetical protein
MGYAKLVARATSAKLGAHALEDSLIQIGSSPNC